MWNALLRTMQEELEIYLLNIEFGLDQLTTELNLTVP